MNADSQLPNDLKDLISVYKARGTSAVAEALDTQLEDPARLTAWRHFAQSQEQRVLEVSVHPHEATAIAWLNRRFSHMGLARLKWIGRVDPKAYDPTDIDYDKIGPLKWLRYVGGPGVAAVAAVIGLPHQQDSASQYALEILPALLIGVMSVLLEAQFAWPWLNNLVWKRVHKFGGLVGARFVNITINFFYGMTLYGVGVVGSQIATALGGRLIPPELSLQQAMWAAFMGAWTFDLALGLFQTDIANQEERGSITGNMRYGLETTGLIVVNGGRIASWMLPPEYGYLIYLVQAEFFLLKTLPLLLKSVVAERMGDRNIYRRLVPSQAPKVAWWEHIARALGGLHLLNLPRLIRAN